MSQEHPPVPDRSHSGAGTASSSPRALDGPAELPIAEVQHRIRNLLAILRSVVRRTAETADTVEDYVMHLEGRLGAIARGQDMALRSASLRGVDLEYLLAEELLAHGGHEGHRVTLAGPRVKLRNAAASLLGLTFHELAVNAIKFGGLSDAVGRVAIQWVISQGGAQSGENGMSLRLEWHETFGSLHLPKTRRAGFGTELIERTLPYELGAQTALTFGKDWVRCTIAVPLSADITAGETGP